MRYLRLPLLTFMFAAMTSMLSACANNPIAIAETASQKGYAIERSYNIILEDALEIGSAPSTSDAVRVAIRDAESTSTPIIDEMSNVLVLYEVERAKFKLGQSTSERLAIIGENLEGWVERAQSALIELQAAFRN